MIYLDNAATSRFKPLRSLMTELRFAISSANPGRGAHKDAIRAATAVEESRTVLSEYLQGMCVIFTKNCTEAICEAIRGLKLKGDAVCSPFEHNAVLRTLERESPNGLKTVFLQPESDGSITAKTLIRALTPQTKLVVLTKMNNVTGAVIDETAIGKALKSRGIYFLLDAAQAMGHTAVNTKFVDMIAASGHKGLHGPAGTGFLAYKERIYLEPLLTGGTGSSTLSLRQPTNFPDGYEAGTQSASAIAALGTAAKWTFENQENINRKIEKLSFALYDGIAKIKGATLYSVRGAPLVTFNLCGKNSNDVAEILSEKYDIAVRAGLHCAPLAHKFLGTEKIGAVRASFGYQNNMSEVKKLLRALAQINF